MCDPVTSAILGFAASAASTVVGYEQQVAAAEQQNEYYVANAKRANESAKQQYAQTQQRMLQEQATAAQDKQDAAREGRAAQATALVSAGESGVAGLSVDALLREFTSRTSNYKDRVDQQTEWSMAQLNNEMKGIKAQADDRINSVQRAAKPSFFDAGLRIATAGLDSYSGYKAAVRQAKYDKMNGIE